MSIKIILSLLTFLVTVSFGQKGGEVTASGYGETKEEAVNYALREALQSVTLTKISSETLVINSKLIEDKISSKSEGFISSYKILSEKEQNNYFFVKVLAKINTKELFSVIKTEKLDIVAIDGESMYVAAESKKRYLDNYLDDIKRMFEGYPEKVLIPVIENITPGILDAQGNIPIVIKWYSTVNEVIGEKYRNYISRNLSTINNLKISQTKTVIEEVIGINGTTIQVPGFVKDYIFNLQKTIKIQYTYKFFDKETNVIFEAPGPTSGGSGGNYLFFLYYSWRNSQKTEGVWRGFSQPGKPWTGIGSSVKIPSDIFKEVKRVQIAVTKIN